MTLSNRITKRAVALGVAALMGVTAVAASLGPAASAAHATVKEFPQEKRYLKGWSSENVPAYQCPTAYPYLEDINHAPFGTSLIAGVSINESASPWPIGVSITVPSARYGNLLVGIGSGDLATSATNWTWGTHWYQVVLHCTDDKDKAARMLA